MGAREDGQRLWLLQRTRKGPGDVCQAESRRNKDCGWVRWWWSDGGVDGRAMIHTYLTHPFDTLCI